MGRSLDFPRRELQMSVKSESFSTTRPPWEVFSPQRARHSSGAWITLTASTALVPHARATEGKACCSLTATASAVAW